MKVVFICGPYRAPTAWGVQGNIYHARRVALKAWKLGAAAICPQANTANMDGELPDHVWLDGAKEILRRCDAVLLVEGWEFSAGSRAEVDLARSLGLPVFERLAQLEEWLRPSRVDPPGAPPPAEGAVVPRNPHYLLLSQECPGHGRGGTGPPCCDHAGEYNGFASGGPLPFWCPKGCSCHD